jgi:hypothetical protein
MTLNTMMMTKNKFSKMIEDIVREKNLTYIDAILYFCETNNVDEEDVKKYVSGPIKSKVEAEAMKLNFLPRCNELPFE